MSALYCFDIDGTLIRSFMREGKRDAYDEVEVLPGRVAKLRELDGAIALVTNQAGVAFGYQTKEQVYAKLGRVLGALELINNRRLSVHVCFSHPTAKPPFNDAVGCRRRKPEPGMLQEAMILHGSAPTTTLFVGDMETDKLAAQAAKVHYQDAAVFFGDLELEEGGAHWPTPVTP